MRRSNLLAKIRNNTANPIAGAQAMLTIDSDTRPVILPTLPAGETTDVPLTHHAHRCRARCR